MKQYEVLVTKVPHRDVREATKILSDLGRQGYEVKFCTMVGNMELLVMLHREIETLAAAVEKAEAKAVKKAKVKKEEAEEVSEE